MKLSRFHFSILGVMATAALAACPMVVRDDLSLTTTGNIHLPDLGRGFYKGFMGGLYPSGGNFRPPAHDSAGRAIAEQIQPPDALSGVGAGAYRLLRQWMMSLVEIGFGVVSLAVLLRALWHARYAFEDGKGLIIIQLTRPHNAEPRLSARCRVAAFLFLMLGLGLLVLPARMVADTSSPMSPSVANVSYERYATTSTGVDLYWTAYVPADGQRHPAVLVLHAGGFKSGDAGPQNVAQDLGNAGFIGLATEYRLAPTHDPMNSPNHPVPGQNDVNPVDDGHYPEQTDDVQLAIRTARADPRCDGRVYCVGGSAGGSHALYMAATGTAGDDRPDLAVGCSGVYNMYDPSFIEQVCDGLSTCPHSACTNYLGIPDNYPNFTPNDIAALTAASPVTYLTSNTCPIFVMRSIIDGVGIPETFDLLVQKMINIGLTESTSNVPEAGKYKQATIPVLAYAHAFEYWSLPFDGVPGHPAVATTVINWLQAGPPTSNPPPAHELLNVSTRTQVLGGDSVLIGGFILSGNVAKTLVLRALGPSLADAGVTGVLADPTLALYDSSGALLQQNDNWTFPLPPSVVAAGLTPKDPAESLIATTLSPGSYTAVLQGAGVSTGVALVELYDLDPANSRISNLSTRGQVSSGNQAPMIGGFIIGETQSTEVLLRALGPSLTALGVSGALLDPFLELRNSEGSLVAENDNWRSSQQQQILATGIPPSNDKEAAIISTLAPGNYTALVYGVGTSSGIALVEVYNLTSN